jgi:hypothetical protein
MESRLKQDRERLFRLSPGGSPERPLDVGSASIVEGRVESMPCPACNRALAVVEHAAETQDGVRLRRVAAKCQSCGAIRDVWFRVLGSFLN